MSLGENGGGNPRTLEDPKGTGVETSGCAGGIWGRGKDERLGCSLGTKLRALREQRVLGAGRGLALCPSCFLVTSQIENEEQEARVARMGRQQVSSTNARSGRQRQKGEALREGIYPDIPAPS